MDMNKIKEWFGEIPAWVSYDQNILSVLNDIQAENGDYYQNRRNIDRDIRNKKLLWKRSQMVSQLDMTLKNGNRQAPEIFIVRSSVCRKKIRPSREQNC